jgi:beta-glucosidase
MVIACLGSTPEMEGEEAGDVGVQDGDGGGDRLRIGLPGRQLEILKSLNASGKPVVLVVTGGSPVELTWAHDNIPAILMAWYPGEAGGQAVADVLFGDYNPAGRLPVTFIRSLDDIPPFEDYAMRGRTYRFMEKEPLYPFGYGLSYTSFAYSNLSVRGWVVRVDVENTGPSDGDEVVQLYISHPESAVPAPIRQLAGFKRVHLRSGQVKTITFKLARRQFAVHDDEGAPFIQGGECVLHAGGGQTGGLLGRMTLRR